MEVLQQIKYDGKTFNVYEPTIDIWQELMLKKEYANDYDLALTVLSWVTGLSLDEIREASPRSIINAADGIINYFTNQSDKFEETFTFADRNYRFIDLPNITFGEYIDIEDVLNKPIAERHKNLNLLMAMLYRELDDKGNYLPYDIANVKENAERFKKLPIKYVKGSTVFFYLMVNMTEENTPLYIHQRAWWILRVRLLKRRLKTLSVGMQRYMRSVGKISLMWKR